jgi:formylglycine-generating enzyme required for sulfatase activity
MKIGRMRIRSITTWTIFLVAGAGIAGIARQPMLRRAKIRHQEMMADRLAYPVVQDARAGDEEPVSERDDLELVKRIRERIVADAEDRNREPMVDYEAVIPATGVPYAMVAIPGGEFLMGSPPDEPGRREDEGPQRRVTVAPFWMGRFEITWDQFEPFMVTEVVRRKDGSPVRLRPDAELPEIVSSPTLPYTEMDFGMGKGRHPAIAMSQHAASKFCQWLSAQTGHFYRLPTEAEWEYACRAGTTTAYSFGDDPADLEAHAWFWHGESDGRYREVGLKKPNPWGLHDMHGNVMEWCLDQYEPDAYATTARTVPARRLFPRVMRGGSWYDDPEHLRSAARYAAKNWNSQDADLPKSIWYLTDARWLGFRLVRPWEIPPAEEMDWAWNSASGLTSSRPQRATEERERPEGRGFED